MAHITAEQFVKYISDGGIQCPVCESMNIEADGNVQVDSGNAWQNCSCRQCGATWIDQYDLVSALNR